MTDVDTFQTHRSLLFGIAYRMLGSAMDAEDIVQETYLRYQKLETTPQNPAAYLRKIVTNLCLDHLKSARMKREQYIGEWLPEPIKTDDATPAEQFSKVEHISIAFLVILETLSPLERAVFLLREVFDYDYDEIAQILDRSQAACRQLLSRAKKHVQSHRPRFDASPETHDRLVTTFITLIQSGNITRMKDMLAEDAALYSDGGGKVSAATRPIHGRDAIFRFIAGLQRRAQSMNITYKIERVRLNGEAGMIIREAKTGDVFLAATFDVSSENTITAIRFVRNPDKLQQL